MTMTCPYFSHLTMSLQSSTSRSEILYDYAIKRANTIIGSQEMTPERMKKMISDFIDTQGLDAPLLSCACCGFRNLDATSTTRSYSEVDLANEKIQSMLKLRDEDDAEDRVDVEDDQQYNLVAFIHCNATDRLWREHHCVYHVMMMVIRRKLRLGN